jgi:hypothetical protein
MSENDPRIVDIEEVRAQIGLLEKYFFQSTVQGLMQPTEHSARWSGLVREAKVVVERALGPLNDFSARLMALGISTSFDGPSLANVEEAQELLGAAVREVRRGPAPTRPMIGHSVVVAKPEFIAKQRIGQLREAKHLSLDFSRLVRLCEELNLAHAAGAHSAVAALQRMIIDHVPPVFGMKSFAEVASNYGAGGKSFKEQMDHLEKSMRKVADRHLHSAMRQHEDLPTEQQVNFSSAIDSLLGEVVRISPK